MVVSKALVVITLHSTVVFHTVVELELQHIFVSLQVRSLAARLYHAKFLNVSCIHNLSLAVEQLKTAHGVVTHG